MNFVDVLGDWVNRYFSRPDAIFLIAALLVVALMLYTLAGALAPVLTGLVLAFLLQAPIAFPTRAQVLNQHQIRGL